MTLKEFAKILDGREYRHEITNEEEALAKELGFVVVFGRSDSSAELRGTIYGEISCYYDGVLEHDDLPGVIYADWCPEDIDCAWAYRTSIPHENFNIYEDGELYCVGIVCDINKPKKTNADKIRAMSDEELAKFLSSGLKEPCDCCQLAVFEGACTETLCEDAMMKWLQRPVEGE